MVSGRRARRGWLEARGPEFKGICFAVVLQRSLRLGELHLKIFDLLRSQTPSRKAILHVLDQTFEISDV